MKNILTLLFIVFSAFGYSQNSDKLTLKGGVMLGVPKNKIKEVNYDVRGQSSFPSHTGTIENRATLNYFIGVEYFPWEIKLSDKGTNLLPFTSLNFLTTSQKSEYKLKDSNNNYYEGGYNIRGFSSGMSVGIKLALEQYKLDLLISTDVLFFSYFSRSKLVNHEYDTDVPFYNFDHIGSSNNSFPSISFVSPFPYNLNIDVRYKLNDFISAQLGFTPVFLGNYHQISFGVTYQLLSHKNKTVEKIE